MKKRRNIICQDNVRSVAKGLVSVIASAMRIIRQREDGCPIFSRYGFLFKEMQNVCGYALNV